MTDRTDSRTVLRYAALVAVLLSLVVVALGVYHSFTRGHLQPLVSGGLTSLCVSAILLLISTRRADRVP